MDAIEEYFQGEYIVEKNKITEIDDLVIEVIKSLTNCTPDIENGFPYLLSAKKDFNSAKDYSTSTNTMIIFVLAKLMEKIDYESPLLPTIEWDKHKELKKHLEDIKINDYYKLLNDKCNELYNKKFTFKNDKDKFVLGELISRSSSFGNNDPFTLSWISELFQNYKDPTKNPLKDIENSTKVVADKIIKISFENPEKPILNFKECKIDGKMQDVNKRTPSNHIFPLLRVIHLYRTLYTNKYPSEKIFKTSNILINLQNRINQQISHYTVQNSLFDTAELVMSLEGMLLLDDKRRIDENLVRKVFDILEANQKNNLNWRPLKPFVTSAQGDVLLPLSIEIANSLLRICKLLERGKRYYFHKYVVIFDNYTQWLLANVSQCTIGGKTYKGWRSEHVQEPDVIHPWETAQVLTYLMTFKTMIQERIAHKSLKKCGLSCSEEYLSAEGGIEDWDEKWKSTETGTDVYSKIRNTYITRNANSSYSMLLFGPPGTGKTAIGEDLAAALKWRLITITPSDFIKNGEADVEGRAKSIFKTLEQQKDCVILFDEIDRLILDRDSIYYNKQGDMFQFMTPSMLVKIKDLRKAEKCIFIIATNYAERIDSAIKRAGRIDEKYLINLPNKEQRLTILKELIGKKIHKDISKFIIKSSSEGTNIYKIKGEIDDLNNKIKDLNNRKLIPAEKTNISEIDIEINALKKALEKRKKELEFYIGEELLGNTTESIEEDLAKDTVFCAFGELKAFIEQACKKVKTIKDFSKELMEVHKNQDKPAVRLTNYSRRFQKDDGKNLPIYPYKEFFNLLDLQLEVTPIDTPIENEQQIKDVFKNVTDTIYQVVSLDSFDLIDYVNKNLNCYDLLVFLRKKYEEEEKKKSEKIDNKKNE